jgi:hypothetical protein
MDRIMTKILFLPFSIASGIVAGLLGRKSFSLLWGRVDEQEPPHPDSRDARLGKLALALAAEGALFRLARGLADHGARRFYARLTGRWPG